MKINPTDIIKLPFKIAESITKPVMDGIEDFMGKDINSFVEALPGGKMLQNATGSFNRWLEAPTGKSEPEEIKGENLDKIDDNDDDLA